MSEGSPLKALPRHIEPRKFAGQSVSIAGQVLSDQLARLAGEGVSAGQIDAHLEFGFDDEKRRVVTGRITAELQVVCQRCLESMALPVDVAVAWAIVWDEEQAKKLPSRLEPWIAGEGPEDLYVMVEEELLLALPTAPMHNSDCLPADLLVAGEPDEPVEPEKNSPFGALAALKGKIEPKN